MKNNKIWNICANTKSTGLKFCRIDDVLQELYFFDSDFGSNAKIVILFYKITKIVRALSLAERRVCMRVCKHGCVT